MQARVPRRMGQSSICGWPTDAFVPEGGEGGEGGPTRGRALHTLIFIYSRSQALRLSQTSLMHFSAFSGSNRSQSDIIDANKIVDFLPFPPPFLSARPFVILH